MTPEERAQALLDQADGAGRGLLKRLASSLDGDEPLRRALVRLGRARGADLPEGAWAWPAKRLLRMARGREHSSRQRLNPVMRDEAFTCAHCGHQVPPQGRTARDHCPRCLRSRHVDRVPGDRAEDCGGLLDPVRIELRHGETLIHYRCRSCGANRVNRALLDGGDPDRWEEVMRVCQESGVPR